MALAAVIVPLVSVVSTVIGAAPAQAASVGVVEFPIVTPSSFPQGIAAGPDAALWFAENGANQIGRIDAVTGTVTEFVPPTASSAPQGITKGPDGALWFTENGVNQIGRITPTGAISEFAVPTASSGPFGIALGPDGGLWFTENFIDKIGRIDPATKAISEFPLPIFTGPQDITAGPNGDLWFTTAAFQIGRITTTGAVTIFTPPKSTSGAINPTDITLGPDSNLWFTSPGTRSIGRLTPAGQFTLFAVATNNSLPVGITVGPDSKLWFTDQGAPTNQIGRFDPNTSGFTEFAPPTASAGATGITTGPDGRLWFTESTSGLIGAASTTATPVAGINAVSPAGGPAGGGTAVTLTGSGFTGATTVTFSVGPLGNAVITPAASFAIGSDSQLTAVMPALAPGRYDITVTTPAASLVALGQFVSNAPLTVLALSTTSGEPAGGNKVTISGTGFTAATAVKFGSALVNFNVLSDNEITTTSPPGTAGSTAAVTVTAAGATSTPGPAVIFTFTLVPVTITSVSPNGASPAPGARPSPITITGTGFVAVTAVNFGATPAAKFTVDSETQITATSPMAPIDPVTKAPQDNLTVDIVVTASEGTSPLVAADKFTFAARPILDFFITVPNTPASSNPPARISGIQLNGTTSVSFGAQTVSCPASCTVNGTGTEIDVTVPPHAVGGVIVKATNADGTSLGGLPFAFTGTGTVNPTQTCELATSTCADAAGAALLPSGKVLGIGVDPTGAKEQANIYDPATGTWTAGAVCSTCLGGSTLTVLPSGKALVIGGGSLNPTTVVANASLYDPATGTWAVAGTPVFFGVETATLLKTGKVLVTTDASTLDDAASLPAYGHATELYDPTTDTFSLTGSMHHEHFSAPATLLQNGKVLIEGDGGTGSNAALNGLAEIYDPASGTWSDVAPMNQARMAHTATLLPDGRVLVSGGQIDFANGVTSTEIYDPIADKWQVSANMTFPRHSHVATLLPNGTVLVVGGDTPDNAVSNAQPDAQSTGNNPSIGEVFDVTAGTWIPTPPTVFSQDNHIFGQNYLIRAVQLPAGPASSCASRCGQVLLIRGHASGSLSIPPGLTDVLYAPAVAAAVTPPGPAVTPVVTPAPATPPGAVALTRLAGAGRIGTAIATSMAAFPTAGSAKAVVLTRDDLFPDALAGVPLAAAKSGPLLLTATATLDPLTQGEITRALPAGGTVYLLGGTSALDPSVDRALQALGFKTVRVSGTDRFSTAVSIAGALGDPAAVIEVSGVNFPDAVSAGPAAIVAHAAILLTNGSTEANATAAYLTAHAGDKRTAVGGPAATADPGASPVVGSDRFATSALVAASFPAPAAVGVATGLDFPDALSGGPFLGSKPGPILLVNPTGPLPPTVSAYLVAHAKTITSVYVFGGTNAVSADVATQVAKAATPA